MATRPANQPKALPTGTCAACGRRDVPLVKDQLCCRTCWSTVPSDLRHQHDSAAHMAGKYATAANVERLDAARRQVLEAIS